MTEHDERVGRLDRGQERAHTATEAATDQRDLVVVGPKRVARGAEILELRLILAARTLPARAELDRPARDLECIESLRKGAQDLLLRAAAVTRREDRGARHFTRARAGSFCARPFAGASRSPTCSIRAPMFAMVNASGRPSAPISSQRSGAETGARRMGRTLYGPAVVLPPTFWRKSMYTPRRRSFTTSTVISFGAFSRAALPTSRTKLRDSSNVYLRAIGTQTWMPRDPVVLGKPRRSRS